MLLSDEQRDLQISHASKRWGLSLSVRALQRLAVGLLPANAQHTCCSCRCMFLRPARCNSKMPLVATVGQPKVFIENQLVLIREGLRDIPQMKVLDE
jgi:hypothetical protein